QVHAYDRAPIFHKVPKFPVLIFSPGFGGIPTQYTAIIEEVVSHGYVVVGVAPTYFAPVVVFPDGREVDTPEKEPNLGYDGIFPIWVNDLRFVLNKMDELNHDKQDIFYQRLDMSTVGAFGHSFGGAGAV